MNTSVTPSIVLPHDDAYPSMSNVSMAVIYHSNYGHTQRVAEAIVKGARQH